MKLKNGILIMGCALVIAGCSNLEKAPFLGKADSEQNTTENGQQKKTARILLV